MCLANSLVYQAPTSLSPANPYLETRQGCSTTNYPKRGEDKQAAN